MRTTQPYRRSQSRAPSQVLERMLAGKKLGAPPAGSALSQALKGARKKRAGLYVPRTRP